MIFRVIQVEKLFNIMMKKIPAVFWSTQSFHQLPWSVIFDAVFEGAREIWGFDLHSQNHWEQTTPGNEGASP